MFSWPLSLPARETTASTRKAKILPIPTTTTFNIKKIDSHSFGYDKALGNVNYRLTLQSMEQVALFLSKFVIPFKDLIPKSMQYKCCPQVYWSAALAAINLCGKECSAPCQLGISIKRNEVLVNGSSGNPAKI